jgi:hypothetical protein
MTKKLQRMTPQSYLFQSSLNCSKNRVLKSPKKSPILGRIVEGIVGGDVDIVAGIKELGE